MRRSRSVLVFLLFVLPQPLVAQPGEVPLPERRLAVPGPSSTPQQPGLSTLAVGDTVYFGGTFWNPAWARWEAIEDSCWTFDSGVASHFDHDPGSFKDVNAPGYHALMEGWEGNGPVDWSNLNHLSDLAPVNLPCTCCMQDSVLTFFDLGGTVPTGESNLAVSPLIDLDAAGLVGNTNFFIQACMYAELPVDDFILADFRIQWYPEPSGGPDQWSDLTSNGFVYYFGDEPYCSRPGEPFQVDFSGIVPPYAEHLRIAVGYLDYCTLIPCTSTSNSTPWFDNVCLGIASCTGSAGLPCQSLTASSLDMPQDAFPQNGTRHYEAPGRMDRGGPRCGCYDLDYCGTECTPGDTLVVRGAAFDSEVYVQFAVEPGPGINGPAFNAWLSKHTFETTWLGQQWYSARMDTAECNQVPVPGVWMTAYHEDDPNGPAAFGDTLVDPGDLDPNGKATRLLYDIFPDDLFTPGTRVHLFYKTRGTTFPLTENWCTFPDTAGGNFIEYEVLPSSLTSTYEQNCVLYVDNYDGLGAQEIIEGALAGVIPGGSANFENVAWDRYDLRGPGQGFTALGRPLMSQNNATVPQLLGYHTIIWNSGNLTEYAMGLPDYDVLNAWLQLNGEQHRLYASGNGLATSMLKCPYSNFLLDGGFGIATACRTVGEAGCPLGSLAEMTQCIDLDPVGTGAGAHFNGNAGPDFAVGRGPDCPLLPFDVLTLSVAQPGQGNEYYDGVTKGIVSFASVSNTANVGSGDFKTVFDGVSLHNRRVRGSAPDYCTNDLSAVEDRLQRVYDWFTGYDTLACEIEPPDALGVGDDPPLTAERLRARVFPNPTARQANLELTLPAKGLVTVRLLDVAGRSVALVHEGVLDEGPNQLTWEARTETGEAIASGMYFMVVQTATETRMVKFLLTR